MIGQAGNIAAKARAVADRRVFFAAQKLCNAKSSIWQDHGLPVYRRRQCQTLGLYAGLNGIAAAAVIVLPVSEPVKAISISAALPGVGFLHWAAGPHWLLACMLCVAGMAVFLLAAVLWFGTGNVVAPLLAWLLLAVSAGHPEMFGLRDPQIASSAQFLPVVAMPTALALLMLGLARGRPSGASTPFPHAPATPVLPAPGELPVDMLRRLRLLQDRALQSVERFDGFEWRDQFQTAAVRYQVNFLSYALSMAHRRFTPAADAYQAEAQRRLLTKIGDRRMWGYWKWENAWGRLRLGADPVPHENIMYSGFTALQMALSPQDGELVLHKGGEAWRRYSLDDMTGLLERQYRGAPYGLLACEPNWIYPLCNLITMTGIKAADAREGTERWPGLAAGFLAGLQREGMAADGSFIAFRCALTGFAPPAPGGIVMQAFPCLFLNGLAPDLAQRHWQRVKQKLETKSWRRLFWPIDVGNYGISRASGYAATAAAAVEMGDHVIARECLQRLEAECALAHDRGVTHRRNASLWAHTLELMALSGGQDAFRGMTENACDVGGPRLAKADYPDILVARAHASNGRLDLVLHVDNEDKPSRVELSGLLPGRHYRSDMPAQPFVLADPCGHATLPVTSRGRLHVTVEPVI